LIFKYFIYLCSPKKFGLKSTPLFGAMGFFLKRPTDSRRPGLKTVAIFYCEGFEDEGQQGRSGFF